MSKRSAPTAAKKRQSQRPHPPNAALRAPSGLPEVILGETKSLVRAPGPPQTRTKMASATVAESKRGSHRASTNSTTATTGLLEIRDCKTSVGRLQSGRRGSNLNGTGGASTSTARTAAVARTSSSVVTGAKGGVPDVTPGATNSLARSSSAPTWSVNPGLKQQPDGAIKARAVAQETPAVAVQQAVNNAPATTMSHQSDTCPSEEEGSDGSGDSGGSVYQPFSGHLDRKQHLDLRSVVPAIPTSGYSSSLLVALLTLNISCLPWVH